MMEKHVKALMMPGGRNIRKGTITRWRKHIGDHIQAGDVIADLTFSGDGLSKPLEVELTATEAEAGVLDEIVVEAGQTVSHRMVIARLRA